MTLHSEVFTMDNSNTEYDNEKVYHYCKRCKNNQMFILSAKKDFILCSKCGFRIVRKKFARAKRLTGSKDAP